MWPDRQNLELVVGLDSPSAFGSEASPSTCSSSNKPPTTPSRGPPLINLTYITRCLLDDRPKWDLAPARAVSLIGNTISTF